MSDYPFFIPEVVLCANSSLFWFKVANEHREFRNYLLILYEPTPNDLNYMEESNIIIKIMDNYA